MFFGGQAAASIVQFQVDYLVTMAGASCSQPGSPFCVPEFLPLPPLTLESTFQETFSLDSSQLAHDGSYSVATIVVGQELGSLSPKLPIIPGSLRLFQVGW